MRVITITFTLLIVILAGAFLIFISDLVPYSGTDAWFRQPKFFPMVSLIALLICGITLSLKYAGGAKLPLDDELSGSTPHFQVLLPLIVLFIGYILAVPLIGYLLSTLIFGIAALVIGRHLNLKSMISLIVLAVLLYLTFILFLDVWFSEPIFSIEGLMK